MSNKNKVILDDFRGRIKERSIMLKLNLPELFEDQEFVGYLNDADNRIATWHRKGDAPDEYSDIFITYDAGEGSNTDMPERWWDYICSLCEEADIGGAYALLHITNLER